MAQLMIVTESEAHEKWCPKSIGEGDEGEAASNRFYGPTGVNFPRHCRCIGSRCMWWMWFDSSKVQGICGAVIR